MAALTMDSAELGSGIEPVAIIGMAGRFPGAKNIDEFWMNLSEGVESVRSFTDEELDAAGIDEQTRRDLSFVNAGAVLPDADMFDAAFFGISAREAEIMDPQHRIFLETAWEALENAGYDSESFPGSIGIYGGIAPNTYFQNNLVTRTDLIRTLGRYSIMLGSEKDYAITRVSFKLNLTGPSVLVNTACSTSGVAIHLACHSLLAGECDMALAGGARVAVPLTGGYLYEEGGIQSPDGHCRAFDAQARGTIVGSGVAILVLKRLSDAIQAGDYIYAVIRGSAINNDGSQKVGFTAPSVQGQASVIKEALAMAGVHPDSIGYVEAHGTGTALGDPIEIAALTKAFRHWTDRRGYCPIGSVKSNIGHLDAAAGAAGVIKTVLALQHGQIPPSVNFSSSNPQIAFETTPFFVNTSSRSWSTNGATRRAGVSSFGLGGTNAHIILEQAPRIAPSGSSRSQQLIVLSAKSEIALERATQNLVEYLRQHWDANLADVAYTLQAGRRVFNCRRMVVCQSIDDARSSLEELNPTRVVTSDHGPVERRVAFMFSGQGSQYANMGLELYEAEPKFRHEVDRCSEILKPYLGLDLRPIIYPDQENIVQAEQLLQQTAYTQPALFATEYAIATLWNEWGIQPSAMVGHSIGEYIAACLAGVFSLEDALYLVSVRGKLMQQLPGGSMLAVPLSESSIQSHLNAQTSLAAVNSPSLCVVSGEHAAIEDLKSQLAAIGVEATQLHTSHAFHSGMMEPVLGRFEDEVRKFKLNAPKIPFLSNITGTWITEGQATDPNYWAKHLRQTVRFSDCVQEMIKEPNLVLLEVGPGRTLTTLARQHALQATGALVLASTRHPLENGSDLQFILNTLGRLWLAGVRVNWAGFSGNELRHRVPVPTYPFERKRYWIAPRKLAEEVTPSGLEEELVPSRPSMQPECHRVPEGAPKNDIERSLANIWQSLLGIENIRIYDNFFDIGGSSLLATRLFTQIANTFGKKLPLATIFQAPTIEQLAAILNQQTAPVADSSLIRIHAGRLEPAFYCVPGNLGNVFTDLGLLSKHLGTERSFYAFQDGIGHPWQVEALAVHYVEELHSVQSKGPYLIAGICSGAVVAFEMAQQLVRQGQRVNFLALIEPAALPLPGARSYLNLLAEIWDRFGHHFGLHLENISPLSGREKTMYVRLRIKLVANLWGLKRYLAQPYPGNLDLFLTAESLAGPRLGWRELAVGGACVHEIPGTHRAITGDYARIEETYMQTLAEMLRTRIGDVSSA